MEQRIAEFLKKREEEGALRHLLTVSPVGGGKILSEGREYVNLSSNDYLGLSSHPHLRAAAEIHLAPVIAASASRLMSGSTALHRELEERTAAFKGKPHALIFNSGYQANVGIISAVCDRGDCVLSDKLNHASIIDGIRLSGAKLLRFRHNDTGHLEELLKTERQKYKGALIVTESVFSMDGHIAPLNDIVRLKDRHDCLLMVDEAHATGIFGPAGSGIVEETSTTTQVDFAMGTFSKALAGFGAYVATNKLFKDYLVNTSRSFIYSTALPPSIVAVNLASLELINSEPGRRKKLLSNADRFRDRVKARGLETRGSSQIIPVITGANKKTVYLAHDLKKMGWWVTPVRHPTVPHDEARLRISLSYDHDERTLDSFIDDLTTLL